jgi:hypothetical protein
MLYQDMEMPETPFGAISAKFQIQLPVTVRILELFRMKNYLKLKRLSLLLNLMPIVHPYFCLFIRSIEYTMKRVLLITQSLPMKF